MPRAAASKPTAEAREVFFFFNLFFKQMNDGKLEHITHVNSIARSRMQHAHNIHARMQAHFHECAASYVCMHVCMCISLPSYIDLNNGHIFLENDR